MLVGATSSFTTNHGEKENGAYIVLLAILWDVESVNAFVSILIGVFFSYLVTFSEVFEKPFSLSEVSFQGASPLDALWNHLGSFKKVRSLGPTL